MSMHSTRRTEGDGAVCFFEISIGFDDCKRIQKAFVIFGSDFSVSSMVPKGFRFFSSLWEGWGRLEFSSFFEAEAKPASLHKSTRTPKGMLFGGFLLLKTNQKAFLWVS